MKVILQMISEKAAQKSMPQFKRNGSTKLQELRCLVLLHQDNCQKTRDDGKDDEIVNTNFGRCHECII